MARIFLLFLVLLLVVPLCACPAASHGSEPSAEASAAYWRGRELFEAERSLEAVVELQRSVDLAPDWADAHLALGKLLVTLSSVLFGTATYDRARLDAAITELLRARELAPENRDGAYWAGHALSVAGRASEAVTQFEAALALDPRHALSTKELGLLYAGEGDVAHAIEYLKRARELLPADAEVPFQLGLQLEAADDLPGAKAAYLDAARLNPAHPGPHARLAPLYQRLGEPENAERASQEFARCKAFGKRLTAALKAVSERSDDPAPLLEVVKLYREMGMKDAARTYLQRALRLAPADPQALELQQRLEKEESRKP